MEEFHIWFKEELRLRGLSQVELAQRVHRTPATVSRWLSGKDIPTADSVTQIAATLDLSEKTILDVLAGREPDWASPPPSLRSLLKEVEAGFPQEVFVLEAREQNDPMMAFMVGGYLLGTIFLPYPPATAAADDKPNYMAFIADQPCMEPSICPGDIVIVDYEASPRPGDIVACSTYPDPAHVETTTGNGRFRRPAGEPRQLMRVVSIRDTGVVSGSARHKEQRIELRSDWDEYGIIVDAYSVAGKVVTTIRDLNHQTGDDPAAWFRRLKTRGYRRDIPPDPFEVPQSDTAP